MGRSLENKWTLPIWLGVWALTRALMVVQVGFWDDGGLDLEDVNVFQAWSDHIAATHAMPVEDSWQYPPGAAFLFLIPRLGPGDFGESFVVLTLLIDLIGFALLALLAKRSGRDTGVWVWLLAMPVLFTLPVLRFDIVPTVIGIAALVVIHRRPYLFGVLAGIGATVKVWPAVVLLAEWNRERLVQATIGAVVAVVLIFTAAAALFGDQSGFLADQSARGLQIEAVATSPWHLRQLVTGEPPHVVQRYGTNEIGSGPADTTADLLGILTFALFLAAAVWWLARDRLIRRGGRDDLTDADVSRDFIFTLVLWLVVTSKVLSPQFMIWLVGLAAVVLTAGSTRLARPAWVVIGAVILTSGVYESPANTLIRNLALIAAAVDATVAMVGVLRRRVPEEESRVDQAAPAPAGAGGQPGASLR